MKTIIFFWLPVQMTDISTRLVVLKNIFINKQHVIKLQAKAGIIKGKV